MPFEKGQRKLRHRHALALPVAPRGGLCEDFPQATELDGAVVVPLGCESRGDCFLLPRAAELLIVLGESIVFDRGGRNAGYTGAKMDETGETDRPGERTAEEGQQKRNDSSKEESMTKEGQQKEKRMNKGLA